MKYLAASLVLVATTAGFAMAADVSVGVRTPNVSVQVGTPQPPPVRVVERERVIVREVEVRKDNGKHKGHYKKHKKHKKHRHD